MANRPIVQIDVDDSAFQKFAAKFDEFNKKLDEMPEAWKNFNAAIGGAGEATGELAAGALTAKEAIALAGAQAAIIAEALTEAVKAQDKLGDSSHGTNKRMSELAKTAKGLAGDIESVGKWVLKLGAGALAGLGISALLGGFGIGELANAAFTRSRTAGGLGLSPGQLKSFQVNAQPFLSESALQGAASAQLSYSSAPYLQMLGIGFGRAQQMNAADLAFEMLRGAVRNWNAAQKSGLPPGSSPLVKAYEELGGNLEDVRRAAAVGPGAINAAQGAYRRDIGVLGFDRGTAEAWTRFKVQLDRAGAEIETVFINKLGPLVPEFTQLSKDAIDAIAGFVNSKDFGVFMKRLHDGLKAFVKWIEGPDPKKLWSGLSLVASEVMAVAEKLKWLVPESPSQAFGPEPGHSQPGYGKMGAMEFDGGSATWVDKNTGTSYDPMSGVWTDKNGNVYDPKTKTWLPSRWSQIGGALGSAWNAITHPAAALGGLISSHTPENNPLDITTGSDSFGLLFAHYKTLDDGIRAGAKRLGEYPKDWGTKTLAAALPLWAGLTNDPKAAANYIANVEKWSGVSRNEPIADFTRKQLAAVVAAMSRMEGTAVVTEEQAYKALYGGAQKAAKKRNALHPQGPIQISITNSTSARVAVSANAVAVG